MMERADKDTRQRRWGGWNIFWNPLDCLPVAFKNPDVQVKAHMWCFILKINQILNIVLVSENLLLWLVHSRMPKQRSACIFTDISDWRVVPCHHNTGSAWNSVWVYVSFCSECVDAKTVNTVDNNSNVQDKDTDTADFYQCNCVNSSWSLDQTQSDSSDSEDIRYWVCRLHIH